MLPQKPHDAGDDPWNKDEAVYATIEPGLAIPFSLRKGYTGVLTVAMEPDKVMATFDAAFESALLKNRGYIYVLDGSRFPERKGVQCKAFEEVVPVDIVEVTVEDFTALGGLNRVCKPGVEMIWTLQFSFGDNIGRFEHLLVIKRTPTGASRRLFRR